MSDLTGAIRDMVEVFEQLSIPYVIMGGIAVRIYGIPRATYDVDFTAAIERNRLPEVYQAVATIGYSVPEAYLSGWVDEVAGMPLVKCRMFVGGGGVDIDIFLAESTFQKSILARRRKEILEGVSTWLVSAEDLILLKLLAYRPRDQADIGDILFTQGQLDASYLRSWAKQMNLTQRLEEALRKVEGY